MAALTASVAALTLAGCYFVSFEDASKDPQYSHLVGAEYRSEKPMAIHGIALDTPHKLEYYRLTDLPGIGGREVLSQNTLDRGMTLKVLSVLRCTDCFLDVAGRVEVVVEVSSSADYNKAPVKMNIKYLEGPERAFTRVAP